MHGSRLCNCKIHKRSWGTRATNYPPDLCKKGQMQFQKKVRKTQEQGQQQGQQFYGKRKQPFHKGPTPATKKPVKAQSNWKPISPSTCMKCGDTHHRQGFPCSASYYQCKNCNRIGYFTSRCLTKAKAINQIEFEKKLTPWIPGKPKVMQTPSTSARYKSNNRHSRRTPKGSASACMLTCHLQPGTTTKMDLPSYPYWPRCRCQPYACVSIQVPNWGQKTSASGTCPMHYDSVHKQHNPKPWKYPSICEISWQTHTEAHLPCDKPRR